jgi:hypothetical protein
MATASFQWLNRTGRGVAPTTNLHLTPNLKKEWNYASTPHQGHHGLFLDDFKLYLLPLLVVAEIKTLFKGWVLRISEQVCLHFPWRHHQDFASGLQIADLGFMSDVTKIVIYEIIHADLFLEGTLSQFSLICKIIIYCLNLSYFRQRFSASNLLIQIMKINTGQWWNASDSGKSKFWKKSLSHCHTNLTRNGSVKNPYLRGEGRLLNAWGIYVSITECKSGTTQKLFLLR